MGRCVPLVTGEVHITNAFEVMILRHFKCESFLFVCLFVFMQKIGEPDNKLNHNQTMKITPVGARF